MNLILLSMALMTAPGREHPFLFLTAEDVARARDNVARDPAFAALAAELRTSANADEHALPALERDWWEADRHKPWKDTYPQIFHHTMIAPSRWAQLAQDCARSHLLAPDETLAAKSKRLLLRLADYSFEFEHYDVGMNYTAWLSRCLDAYDILYSRFGVAERAHMDAFFERGLAAVNANDDYWVKHEPGGPMNNHYAWHKLCRCMIGLFYDRPQLVEEALHGPKGVIEMFQHGFRDDGLWLEGSIPYQFAATAAFLIMAEILENAGYPARLWTYATSDGRNLKQSYDALLALLFPDGVLPPIGDCYARRPHLGENGGYETLYARFREPRYAWLLAGAPQRSSAALFAGRATLDNAAPPLQYTRLWPEQGYAALRSQEGVDYWRGEGITLFATYSNAPVHTNADKLSIMLFGAGRHWLVDREAATSAGHPFSARVQNELNRETLCHNTVMVDGQSQRHPDRRLDLLEFHALPEVKRLHIADLDGRLYEGVRQSRACIVTASYALDLFQLQAEGAREYTWLLHVEGESVACSAASWRRAAFPATAPWSYMQTPETAGTADTYGETFAANEARFRVDVAADGEFEVLRCGFPRDDGDDGQGGPMRLLRCRRPAAWFAAIYRCNPAGDAPARICVTPGPLGTYSVAVRIDGRDHEHIIARLDAVR